MTEGSSRSHLAATVLVAVVLGAALWFHLGFEHDAGSHRIAISTPPTGEAAEDRPSFSLHIGHGLVAGPDQFTAARYVWFDADPFEWPDSGTFVGPSSGGTAVYAGPIASPTHVQWTGGSADSWFDLEIDDGPPVRVEMPAGEAGLRPIPVDLALPRASWLLLGVFIIWMLLPARAIVDAIERRRDQSMGLTGPVAMAVAGTLVVIIGFPLDEARTTELSIEVTPIGPSPLGSQGAETWIRIVGPDGENPSTSQLSHPDWVPRGPFVVGNPDAAPLRATISAGPDDRIEFASIAFSGLTELRVNGEATTIDTFAGEASFAVGQFVSGRDALVRAIALIATFASTALALLYLALRVERSTDAPQRTTASPVLGRTVPYAALPALIWTTGLVVVWPGMMNPDSLSQWRQFSDGALTDWHPYLTTLLMATPQVIVDSPWLPILATVGAASLVLGALARLAADNGCPHRTVLVALVMASGSPALLLMGVVLWKDAIMGVALLASTLVVWRAIDDDGWLGRRANLALAVAAFSLIWLSRHNGWPVVLATIGTVALLHRQLRRQLGLVLIAVLAIVGMVRFPLASALDVEPNATGGIAFLQRVSLHVNAGTDLTQDEQAFLESIRPLDQPWPYNCASVQPTWAGPESIPLSSYAGLDGDLLRLAVRLGIRNPGAEFDHLVCSTRLLWQMDDQGSITYLIEHGATGPLHDTIRNLYDGAPVEAHPSRRLSNTTLSWLLGLPAPLHRPALYLLPFALSAVATSVRRRSTGPLLIACPALYQAGSIVPFALVQDTRFLFGAMMVSGFLTPLLATSSRGTGSTRALDWVTDDHKQNDAPTIVLNEQQEKVTI